MLWFVLVAAGMWILQGLLGFWQLRHFNQRFNLLRKEGRVVVGKSKGRIMAGAVLMFCLDKDCNIIKGEKMEGISIFSRMKPFNSLNNLNLLELEEDKLSGLGRPTSKAIMNAIENYRAFINKTKNDMEVIGVENERITV
ncbi:transcriptional regulator GutM [Pelosinus sp. UFO1]|uniref:transcriptional regulator GutM n=1 Tax=Pelosinus sp. UFO1 TaxID=484770 RepID=UPI0004D1F50A|nr:transcriptional regulator GutM [Pelosinus sp. UFO1]AIF53043.1 glucitol operon transcriptional acivator GutM [Pelosinus sp. UFO1]